MHYIHSYTPAELQPYHGLHCALPEPCLSEECILAGEVRQFGLVQRTGAGDDDVPAESLSAARFNNPLVGSFIPSVHQYFLTKSDVRQDSKPGPEFRYIKLQQVHYCTHTWRRWRSRTRGSPAGCCRRGTSRGSARTRSCTVGSAIY